MTKTTELDTKRSNFDRGSMLYRSQETTPLITPRKGKISQLDYIGVLRHPDCPEMRLIGREGSAYFLDQSQSEV